MLYDGEEVDLLPHQEEVATHYALVPLDGPNLGDPETAPTFQANFFRDFKALLPADHPVKRFDKCDFGPIRAHVEQQRDLRKARTEVDKETAKADKTRHALLHGFCMIDGRLEKVGNTNMEPPSLFRGRGKHPKTGTLKQRTQPEQVTLNVGVRNPVPRCTVPGHAWAAVQHDNAVQWLAAWHENVQNQSKYVMLASQSSVKGISDRKKYQKAMMLKGSIEQIRKDYTKNLSHSDDYLRQIACAMWLIDVLALRVGGEKSEEEADTVGCCSLRREHFTFSQSEGSYDVELEFLGKDSMLFKQTIVFDSENYGDNGKKVYKNLKDMCKNKRDSEEVFDQLTPTLLNQHLKTIMPGLTAKVFRTYNASETLQRLLLANATPEKMARLTEAERVTHYNDANREVAILCNHQKTVSKAQQAGLDASQAKLDAIKAQKAELQEMLGHVKKGKESKIKLSTDTATALDKAKAALDKAKAMKESAQDNDAKFAAIEAEKKAKEMQKAARDAKADEAHLWARPPTAEAVEKRIEVWTEKIRKMEIDVRNKDENKEVSLGASKTNCYYHEHHYY